MKHINDEGVVGDCGARSEASCPFNERGHFNSKVEAEVAAQGYLEGLYYENILKSFVSELRVESPEDSALKDLAVRDLSGIVLKVAKREGFAREMSAAVVMATILHENQTRFNRGQFEAVPYIEHPLRNAVRISRWGVVDRDVLIAAVLHDTIEDGSVDYARLYENDSSAAPGLEARERLSKEIYKRFGGEVLRVVKAVSNDFQEATNKREESLEEKAMVYREHVECSLRDYKIFLVKLSDFVDNATGLYHSDSPERREKIYRMAYKYLPVVEVFENKMSLVDGVISDSTASEIRAQLERTRERLGFIVERGL